MVMVWEADNVIDVTRKMMGATFGYYADVGTIRGDFSCSERYNIIHGSDSPESAQQEIKLFFATNEIIDYKLTNAHWLYGKPVNPKK
jgi:nucleoside-diphosphate kinase